MTRPPLSPQEEELVKWYVDTWAERADAVAEGYTVPLDWLIDEYRVSWSEVVAKAEELGIKRNAVELRIWWDNIWPSKRRPK